MIDISKFDRFDLAQALYWYADQNHGGQFSAMYALMQSIGYSPGMIETAESLDGDAAEVYQLLSQGDLHIEDVSALVKGAV